MSNIERIEERVILAAFFSWYEKTDISIYATIPKSTFWNSLYQLSREYPEEIPVSFEDGRISNDLYHFLTNLECLGAISSSSGYYKKLTPSRKELLEETYPFIKDYFESSIKKDIWYRRFIEIINLGV